MRRRTHGADVAAMDAEQVAPGAHGGDVVVPIAAPCRAELEMVRRDIPPAAHRAAAPVDGSHDAPRGISDAWSAGTERIDSHGKPGQRLISTPKTGGALLDAGLADALLGMALRWLASRAAIELRVAAPKAW